MKSTSIESPYQPEEQFKTFFKQSTGFVGAIVAGMPVIAGYLDVVPPPGANTGKAISILAMALSATIFLSLFWFRDRLATMQAMKHSWTAIVIGAIVLVVYLQLMPAKDIKPDPLLAALNTGVYFAGFVALLGGFSGVFVCGFVRSKGR